MNETVSAINPEQSAQLAERTNTIMRLLRGDSPALALDALLSAYTTVAVGFGRTKQSAHSLRLLSGILDGGGSADAVQQAIGSMPSKVLKVPMPERPPGALPEGFTAGDIARIEALVATVLDLFEGEKGHIALSVLITCYSQVADHVGDTAKAGRELLAIGARMAATPLQSSGTAGDPVPPLSATLH